MRRITYVCATCGGKNVKWDAWAEWDEEQQCLVLANSYDQNHCDDCDGECSVEEVELDEENQTTAD